MQAGEVQFRHGLLAQLGGAQVLFAVRPVPPRSPSRRSTIAPSAERPWRRSCAVRSATRHLVVPIGERAFRHVHDDARPDEPPQRNLVGLVPAARGVDRRVEMRAAMLRRRELLAGSSNPCWSRPQPPARASRFRRGPVDRLLVERMREVDELALQRLRAAAGSWCAPFCRPTGRPADGPGRQERRRDGDPPDHRPPPRGTSRITAPARRGASAGTEDDASTFRARRREIDTRRAALRPAPDMIGPCSVRAARATRRTPTARRPSRRMRRSAPAPRTALERLLREHPELATARLGRPEAATARTLLHVVTDWPGHVPDAARKIAAARRGRRRRQRPLHRSAPETPLHWAASSDDVEALDALLDAGADLEADGAVIAGGTPMADAVAFAQWKPPAGCSSGARDDPLAGGRARTGRRVREQLAETPPPAGGARQRALVRRARRAARRPPSCCSTAAPTRPGSGTTGSRRGRQPSAAARTSSRRGCASARRSRRRASRRWRASAGRGERPGNWMPPIVHTGHALDRLAPGRRGRRAHRRRDRVEDGMTLHADVAPGVHRIEDAFTNWYLVEAEDGLTIVDAGVPSSWASLLDALEQIGRPPVTSSARPHPCALRPRRLRRAARAKHGVPVYVHDNDVPLCRHPGATTTNGTDALPPDPGRALPIVATLLRHRAFWPAPIRDVVRYATRAAYRCPAPRCRGHTRAHAGALRAAPARSRRPDRRRRDRHARPVHGQAWPQARRARGDRRHPAQSREPGRAGGDRARTVSRGTASHGAKGSKPPWSARGRAGRPERRARHAGDGPGRATHHLRIRR